MPELLVFFIILFAGLIFSQLFNRLHLPYVTALVLAGVIVGPHGMGLIAMDDVVSFFASVGVIFLMFIAGSEVKTDIVKRVGWDIGIFALINGLIPLAVGLAIGLWLGLPWLTSMVLGVVFVSSSVAVIVPVLEKTGILKSKLGELLLTAAVFEDVASLLLLSFLLQSAGEANLWMPLAVMVLAIIILVLLRIFIPKIRRLMAWGKRGEDLFESELRFVFVVLLATVVLFEVLGLHAIVAGFLIGIVLGDSMRGRIEQKVHTVGYGLFIPIFFIAVGMQLDLAVFASRQMIGLLVLVIVGAVLAKVLSGMLGIAMVGYKETRQRLLAGVVTTPHLSTALAAAFTAAEFGLLSKELVSALIVLSVVTTLIAPLLIRMVVLKKGRVMV